MEYKDTLEEIDEERASYLLNIDGLLDGQNMHHDELIKINLFL